MPTGYTAKLHDGEAQTFQEFAMSCARAFGALITMRDESMDADVPEEFTESSYFVESVERDAEALREAQARTDEEWSAVNAHQYQEALAAYETRRAQREALRARYEAMLAEVAAWEPPTSEHQGLQEFMIQQLSDSLKFDCHEPTPPTRVPDREFKTSEMIGLAGRLERSAQYLREERERVKGRNAWVRALRESLAGQVANA